MRGDDLQPEPELFIYSSLEQRIPADHPLRGIRGLVDEVLRSMSEDFDQLYARAGRPSVAPERLLRALLLQVFYTIRSERLLMEQLDYNLLFRWFVGMGADEAVWHHAVFSKNRERLLNQELVQVFFARVTEQATGLMSDEHFTVDGTLMEAWAGQKSFRAKDTPRGGGGAGEFRGEQRRNDTHQSRTDPEARLYRKGNGQEAKLAYLGHVLIENRNGLIAAAMATQADGFAERDAGLLLADGLAATRGRRTLGADKGYDSRDFVSTVRELGFTPHVNQNQNGRRSAVDGRTTRHPGYALSLSKRWLVEKPFAWMKSVGWIRKLKLRGLAKVDWAFVFACAAFNLLRIPKLRRAAA
ncbi:MAG: IS5 family transposase [Terriglobales bacterium]